MNNIVVIANLTIKEEFLTLVYEALVRLHKMTNENDKGCISYKLHKDISRENSYTFIEIWENEEALKLHTQKEHFQEFTHFIDGKIVDMSVKKLEEIAL
ncbi:antibiotic biosynthesis monooxygenase [Halarcobacter ebronensis]|uniref:Antibiotic biosynthesis monooxygenase n=1 Tax=Halarcobacter ebronensis TaxID=1462615 RepID=A0A4Q0YC05_9BACT|nr:antibiotic biosynthesis monooxygenase family protein [Halarcobacter ebronensis]RXJ66411.1 antibiotic biosynthesis monooxygenase [Halarcobacter ebronensis]